MMGVVMIGVKHVDSEIPAGRTRPLLAKSQVEGHGVISKNEILSRVEIENLALVHGPPGKITRQPAADHAR